MGLSVAVCGPGSIEQAHKPDEFVSLTQISACLEMLDGLLQSPFVTADADQDAALSKP